MPLRTSTRVAPGRRKALPSASTCHPAWINSRTTLGMDLRPMRHTDRKSTRLNSSHLGISYAVFCLKKYFVFRVRRHSKPNRRQILNRPSAQPELKFRIIFVFQRIGTGTESPNFFLIDRAPAKIYPLPKQASFPT